MIVPLLPVEEVLKICRVKQLPQAPRPPELYDLGFFTRTIRDQNLVIAALREDVKTLYAVIEAQHPPT